MKAQNSARLSPLTIAASLLAAAVSLAPAITLVWDFEDGLADQTGTIAFTNVGGGDGPGTTWARRGADPSAPMRYDAINDESPISATPGGGANDWLVRADWNFNGVDHQKHGDGDSGILQSGNFFVDETSSVTFDIGGGGEGGRDGMYLRRASDDSAIISEHRGGGFLQSRDWTNAELTAAGITGPTKVYLTIEDQTTSGWGNVSADNIVVTNASVGPEIKSFTATPNSLVGPGNVNLEWEVEDADMLSIDSGVGNVTGMDNIDVAVTTTTTFTLTASGAAGESMASVTVNVADPPIIHAFSANPDAILEGTLVTLSWDVEFADTIVVDNGVGDVTGANSVEVFPLTTTTYELTASNANGDAMETATVTVTPIPQANLLGLYTFDDLADPYADRSGNDNHGANIGDGTIVEPPETFEGAGALDLDNAFGFDVPIDINPGLARTVGGWINLDANSDEGIFGHDNGGWDRGLMVQQGTFRMTGQAAPRDSGIPAPLGSWQLFAVSFSDGPNPGTHTLFVDDHPPVEQSFNPGGGVTNTSFGSFDQHPVNNHPVDGRMDNLFIFDRALTQLEIMMIRIDGVRGILRVGGIPVTPFIDSFSATPNVLAAPGVTELTWIVDDSATELFIDNGVGAVSGQTEAEVAVAATTTFTLRATNDEGDSFATVTVTVNEPPEINSFAAEVPRILAGTSTTLSWDVEFAATLRIDNGIGDVTGMTSIDVTPAGTTTYTLTATNVSGESTAETTVTVVQPPTADLVWDFEGRIPVEGDPIQDRLYDQSGNLKFHLVSPGEVPPGSGSTFDRFDEGTPSNPVRYDAINDESPITDTPGPDPLNEWLLRADWGFDGASHTKHGDGDTGEFVSDTFAIDELSAFTMDVGGGSPPNGLYLHRADDDSVIISESRGGGFVQQRDWTNTELTTAGVSGPTEVYLRVADETTGGWGNVSVDNIVGFGVSVPGTAPFAITEILYLEAGPQATITWNSRPGATYAIDVSDNLNNWFELDDGVESEGETTSFTDDNIAPDTTRLFYRIRDVDG